MTADTPQPPNQTSSLSDWLNYMQQIHVSAIDMGLSRVMPVAKHLGLLQSAKQDAYVFTVAGTNGKGSTTAVISEICIQAGYKTALYQSPHLIDFNERVRINGKSVADEVLVHAFVQVEAARLACDLTLSFFEMTTLAAMLIFAQADCDVWVLEVGLGGRLDVVNIIDPDLAVITNIGIDHVEWLGNTRELIGLEKAGILRKGATLIYGSDDMPVTVKQKIDELDVTCYQAGRDFDYLVSDSINHSVGQSDWQFSSAVITMQLPLPALSVHNSANAVAAVVASRLNITQTHIADGLRAVKLAGRFDVRKINEVQWVFDVAHNAEGIAFLLPQFAKLWKQRYQPHLHMATDSTLAPQIAPNLHIILSMLADKAIKQVTELLLHGASSLTSNANIPRPKIHWHISSINHPRAADTDSLIEAIQLAQDHQDRVDSLALASRADIITYDSLAQAGRAVAHLCQPEDMVLVCGSFHTIGSVLQGLDIKAY